MRSGWRIHLADDQDMNLASEGGDAPFLLAELERAESAQNSQSQRLALALQSVETDRLLNGLSAIFTRARAIERDGALAFDGGLPDLDFDGALLIGGELTRRGVPPIFRRLPYYCGADASKPYWYEPDADLLALMLDAEWLVQRHPLSECAWEAAARLYDPKQFRTTCNWLHWSGRRSAGQIAIALGLTLAQQSELAFIQYLTLARSKRGMWTLLPAAEARIKAEASQRAHDRRTPEQREVTVRRRVAIWLCGQLAGNKPQRTAELVEMLTGEALARGIVARHLEKLPNLRRYHPSFPT